MKQILAHGNVPKLARILEGVMVVTYGVGFGYGFK